MECCICYCKLKKENLAITKCKHTYCLECILKHYSSSNPYSHVCPMCRTSLLALSTPPNSPISQPSYIDYVLQPSNYFVIYDSQNDDICFNMIND